MKGFKKILALIVGVTANDPGAIEQVSGAICPETTTGQTGSTPQKLPFYWGTVTYASTCANPACSRKLKVGSTALVYFARVDETTQNRRIRLTCGAPCYQLVPDKSE